MIRVISDSSHGTFFTKCKRCRSGIAYDYTDVKFEDIPYSFVPKRTISRFLVFCECLEKQLLL